MELEQIYIRVLNKGFGSKSHQISPKEGQMVQRPNHRAYGNTNEANSPDNMKSVNSDGFTGGGRIPSWSC